MGHGQVQCGTGYSTGASTVQYREWAHSTRGTGLQPPSGMGGGCPVLGSTVGTVDRAPSTVGVDTVLYRVPYSVPYRGEYRYPLGQGMGSTGYRAWYRVLYSTGYGT